MFLLGAEREGLPAEVERDLEVTIPVASESLNVAAAGAIALYEWRRARTRPSGPATSPSSALVRRDPCHRRTATCDSTDDVQSRLRQTQIESSWPAQGVPSNQP